MASNGPEATVAVNRLFVGDLGSRPGEHDHPGSGAVYRAEVLAGWEDPDEGLWLHVRVDPPIAGPQGDRFGVPSAESYDEVVLAGLRGDIRQARVFAGGDPDPIPQTVAERYGRSRELHDIKGAVMVWVFADVEPPLYGARLVPGMGRSVRPFGGAQIASHPNLFHPTPHEVDEMYFALLEQFVAREGHADVPHGHLEDGVDLSHGLGHWKSDHQKGYISEGLLSEEMIERLEAIPGWSWDDRDVVDLAAQFQQREGHLMIPRRHVEDGWELGTLFARAVNEYRKRMMRPGPFYDHTTLDRLETLPGWEELIASDYPRPTDPNPMVDRIVAFTEREGRLPAPDDDNEDGKRLYPTLLQVLIKYVSDAPGLSRGDVTRLGALPDWPPTI